MTLPRNVYAKGTGYRGQRMVKGRTVVTKVLPTPQMAEAALAELVAGGPGGNANETPDVQVLLGDAVRSVEQARHDLGRALLALQREQWRRDEASDEPTEGGDDGAAEAS